MEKGVDCLICTGELSRHMYEGALKSAEAGEKHGIHYFPDRESLLEGLSDLLLPGDTILVKASHGMGFEKVVEQLT